MDDTYNLKEVMLLDILECSITVIYAIAGVEVSILKHPEEPINELQLVLPPLFFRAYYLMVKRINMFFGLLY